MSAEKLEEPNLGGRPKGSGRKISKLKRIANRVEEMARTQGLEIIQKSLNGDPVDKDSLATAKWTVNTAQQLHKAVLQEEESLRMGGDETPVDTEESEGGQVVKFSLVMPKENKE